MGIRKIHLEISDNSHYLESKIHKCTLTSLEIMSVLKTFFTIIYKFKQVVRTEVIAQW